MNKKIILPGFLLLGVLLIGGILWFAVLNTPDNVTTRVVLAGREDLPVTGQYTADGKEYQIDEVLPAEITVTAKRLSLLAASSRPTESISAKVFVDDEHKVSGSARQIQITVKGDTMFSPSKAHLRAFYEPVED